MKDPYLDLKVGDTVLLSSPLVDPIHWFYGEVLWRCDEEILVQQHGIAAASPHRHLHEISYVRFFGTREQCAEEKRRLEKAVRDAAAIVDEIRESSREMDRKLVDLFEQVAADALKAVGARL